MAYLHSRSYFDETDLTFKKCILHRDLKVVKLKKIKTICSGIAQQLCVTIINYFSMLKHTAGQLPRHGLFGHQDK